MKLLEIAAIAPAPWKNGGGFTREIALCPDDIGFVWRLSLADVERAGPFSIFPGLARVLTVIDGAGLRLVTPGGVIDARPGVPVKFGGDIPIDCELVAGAVRDFNLIYNPQRVEMAVERLSAGAHRVKGEGVSLLPLGAPCALQDFGAVPAGSCLLFEGESVKSIDVENAALLVTISHARDNSAATALR